MKTRILPCLMAVCMLFSVLSTSAYAADAWEVKSVAYDDIAELVDESVNFNTKDIDTSVSEIQSTLGFLNTYVNDLATKLNTLDPNQNSAEYKLTSQQLSLAKANTLQMNLSLNTLKETTTQLDSARDSTVIAARTLFITYNSLQDQITDLSQQKALVNAKQRSFEQQYQWGFISSLDLEKSKNQVSTMETTISSMEVQATAIKRSFNTLLGRNYNQNLTLKSLPFKRLDDIDELDFSKDVDVALSNYNGNTSGSEYQNPDYDEEKGSFAASFRKLYDTIQNKNNALTAQKAALDTQQKLYNASKAQFDAGLISKLTLDSAKSALDTQELSVKAAQTDLFTAYEQYQWAMEYGIINSDS